MTRSMTRGSCAEAPMWLALPTTSKRASGIKEAGRRDAARETVPSAFANRSGEPLDYQNWRHRGWKRVWSVRR